MRSPESSGGRPSNVCRCRRRLRSPRPPAFASPSSSAPHVWSLGRCSSRATRSSSTPDASRSTRGAFRPTSPNVDRLPSFSASSNASRGGSRLLRTSRRKKSSGCIRRSACSRTISRGCLRRRRRRRSAIGTPQTGVATYYFHKAAESDPDDPDYFFNLGYGYWQDRDTQAAIYWLREAVRRNPADGDAHFVLGASLAAAGRSGEAAREKELARRLSSTYE